MGWLRSQNEGWSQPNPLIPQPNTRYMSICTFDFPKKICVCLWEYGQGFVIRLLHALRCQFPKMPHASLITSFSFPPVRGHKRSVVLPEANKIAYQTRPDQTRSQTKMGSRNAVVHTSFDQRSRNFQPTGANQDRWGRRITHRTGMCQSRTTLMVQSATWKS